MLAQLLSLLLGLGALSGSRAGLRAFGAVLGAALLTARDPSGVQGAAHDVISHAGQVLDAAAADEHDRVLLQVVAHAWDISRHFNLVCQANARDFTQGRIRLLGRSRVNPRADSPPLRAGLQRRARGLVSGRPAPFADKLIKRRHELTSVSFVRASFPPRGRKRAFTHLKTIATVGEFPKTWRRRTGTYRPSR